jgi:hypothetical protein
MTDDIEAWLLSFDCGKKWFNTIASARTKEIYSKDMKQYCDAVGKTPDELLKFKPNLFELVQMMQQGTANADSEFLAENLLDSYLYNTPDEEVTIHIKLSIMSAVKSFYKANRRELNSTVGKNLTPPEPEKRTPKLQDIVAMEEAMAYQRDKAVLWFLESTPVRHATFVNLYWRDLKSTAELLKDIREEAHGQLTRSIDKDKELAKLVPYYIVLGAERLKGAGKGKYKGVKHIGFLHYYAVEKLEKYKLELKQYGLAVTPDTPIFLALSNNRFNDGKGDRLKGISVIFSNACELAWKDENKRFSPQDMRDVLQGALEKVEVNKNLISPLISHKVVGVDKHYSNHEIDEFLQVFVRALPLLVPQTVEQVRAETQTKLAEEQKRIVNLEFENTTLKANVNSLNKDQEWLKGQVEFLKQYVFDDKTVIETEEDVAELQAFLEKKRKQKENQNQTRAEDVEEEK